MFNIQPKNITTTISQTFVKFKIENIIVTYDLKAEIYVALYTDTDIVRMEIVTLEGPEYDAWGTDDKYIKNKVIEKLNLVLE